MSNLSEVIARYEKILDHKTNKQNKKSMSGYFKNESLEIGVEGINDEFLEKIKLELERYIDNLDGYELFEKKDMSELIGIPGVKEWLKYYQAVAHESFHFLQSLTLQAAGEYVYWIRQFRDFEFMVFAVHLANEGHWKFPKDPSKPISIFNAIPDLVATEFRDWISKKFLQNRVRFEIFTSYRENKFGVSTIELIEGSAVAFQELVTHSVGINVHNFDNSGTYTNAYKYFIDNGGNELYSDQIKKTVFLCITYTALYYGSVSKLHGGSEWDDPVQLFIYLCKSTKEYGRLLMAPTILFADINKFEKLNKKDPTYKIKEFPINEISYRYIENLGDRLEPDQFQKLSQHIYLLKRLRESACIYFSLKKLTHMCNVRKHLDRKMKPLYQNLTTSFPLFDNFYFIAFLLWDTELSPKFINMIGNNQLGDVVVQSANGKDIENELDTAFSRCMNDFKDYLKFGAAYCCEKHGNTSKKREMFSCTEPDSLRQRIKMFGNQIELKNTVIFPAN